MDDLPPPPPPRVWTEQVQVPFAFIGDTLQEVRDKLALTARRGAWQLPYEPIDGRVLWTFGDGFVTLFYRVRGVA